MFAVLQANVVGNVTNFSNGVAPPPSAISATEQAEASKIAAQNAGVAHHTLIDMVMDSSIISKIVLIILVLCAIYALAILFEKQFVLSKSRKLFNDFMLAFKKAKTPDDAFIAAKSQPESGIKNMFMAGYDEILKTRELGLYNMERGDHTLVRVQTAMDIEQNKSISDLGSNMTYLASIGSNAPFIGLFGTVVGIMQSFIGIANTQTTSLSVVAPGIAEALLATAAGLVAAIPAVLIYNFSSSAISNFSGQMDDFKAEFLSLLSRDMDSQN